MRVWQISAVLFAAGTLAAQTPAAVHALGPVIATAPGTFGQVEVGQVLTFDDGRAIVADGRTRTVWLFDQTFANPIRVLDSMPGRATTFSPGSFVMPYRGDTALTFDRAATAIVAIGPNGALGRTFAAPPARPVSAAAAAAAVAASRPPAAPVIPGFSDFDAFPVTSLAFGFVYGLAAPTSMAVRMAGTPRVEDSMYIARMDLGSRHVDTLAKLIASRTSRYAAILAGAYFLNQPKRRPDLLTFADAAAVTTDGSIAMLHGHDYRLEWISPDGSHSSTKLTYPWRRISDAERQHMVDSLNATGQAKYDSALAKRAADSARTGSAPMGSVVYGDGRRGQVVAPPPRPPIVYIVEDVPDYFPPIDPGAMLADRDNNVWIQPNVAVPDPAGAVWEVVNRKSVVIDRVRIPNSATIVGFGPGGIVYLTTHDAGKLVLQKVRVRG